MSTISVFVWLSLVILTYYSIEQALRIRKLEDRASGLEAWMRDVAEFRIGFESRVLHVQRQAEKLEEFARTTARALDTDYDAAEPEQFYRPEDAEAEAKRREEWMNQNGVSRCDLQRELEFDKVEPGPEHPSGLPTVR